LTISAYLFTIDALVGPVQKVFDNLLGELDVVKNDERTLDIENSTVVDSWSDVVVTSGSFDIGD
jgi:hypothetical protein